MDVLVIDAVICKLFVLRTISININPVTVNVSVQESFENNSVYAYIICS